MTIHPPSAHRSGPVRSDDARRAILGATAAEFQAKGYAGFTIQGVASAARVGKQTIYRWWDGKAELLADCLAEGLLWDSELVVADTGDVVADVAGWIGQVLDLDRSGPRELLRSLLGAAATDEALAERLDTLLRGPYQGGVTHRLDLARSRGEVPDEVNVVLASDLLVGLLVVRTLTRRPTGPAELRATVRQLLLLG